MMRYPGCNRICILGSGYDKAAAAKYESEIEIILDQLRESDTGKCVFTEIMKFPRMIFVKPYDTRPVIGQCNAAAIPHDGTKATAKGQLRRDKYGNPLVDNKETGQGLLDLIEGKRKMPEGTGEGSASEVRFSASTFAPRSICRSGIGTDGDELLLHELIHALRHTSGKENSLAMPDNPGMDNYEEFLAILVSNIYRSEIGVPKLRKDHRGYQELTGDTTDPVIFADTYFGWLLTLKIEQPALFDGLKAVPSSWNPLAHH